MACPDPEAFEQLFGGALPAEERARIADHAGSCRDCRALLDALMESSDATVTLGSKGVPAAPDVGFGLGPGAQVARYVIERRIGQGGMGVVYAARDPELGRGIAIKMLRTGAPAARLRREAQALARLSHPNVVAVHDVGEHDGRTFIAMALVDGDNLRRWLETPRTTDEILRVLLAAGRGIAAAHAAGMIDRDLKPDNIFVARDGAVLVGDFGLAREAESGEILAADASPDTPVDLTATGTILGTPAYMAPEQAKGDATEASDQFAFCITAWEALYGARPYPARTVAQLRAQSGLGDLIAPADDRGLPSRAGAALRRGLSPDPRARFPSMPALLDELTPRRRRWPWILAGTTVVATIAVLGALQLRHHDAESCDTGHLLDEVWGPTQRAATTLVPATTSALDAYAQHWLATRNELCLTRGELGATAADARLACLERRRTAFAVVVSALATRPDAMNARAAVDALPSIDDCAHATGVVPPEQRATVAALERRLATLETGYRLAATTSIADVTALVVDAEAAHADGPLVGALVLEGGMLYPAGLPDDAEPILRRALAVAERSGDDLTRVHASVELIEVLVRLQRVADAHNVLDQATAILARIGTSHELELELVMARSTILTAEGKHRAAADLLRGYVAAREQDHDLTDLAVGYLALGRELIAAGDPDGAAEAFRKLAEVERQIGGPQDLTADALDSEAMAASTAGNFERAIELDERALAIVRSKPHSPDVEAEMLGAVGRSYYMAGAWVQMREASEAELALLPDDPDTIPRRAETFENIGYAQFYSTGPTTAIDRLREAVAAYQKFKGDDTNAVLLLALALVEAKQYREVRTLIEARLPALVAADPPRPWRTANASYALARALWEDGDDAARGRARALAADAERDFVDGIDKLSKAPNAATTVRVLRDRLAALRAWRERH